ncbi:MAG: ATP-binding protein [Acidiferrobacteraceae bacterium]|jgi:two-component system sensor histidine kinase CpxA
MGGLFWKIFLSFWAALVLFSAATIWTASSYLEHTRHQRLATRPHERMASYFHQARRAIDHGGIKGLKTWAHDVDLREPIPLLVLDSKGEDLLGRPVPPRLAERIRRYNQIGVGHRDFGENDHHMPRWLRHGIEVPGMGTVYLIPDFQSVTLGRVLSRPRVIALPVVVAALVSGLVCLLLARYLTAPVTRLRTATRRFANGDLSQRVGATLGNRRDEIADLARDFDHMAERLDALLASHRQLLRDASHELRSPLARLQVALGLTRQRGGEAIADELDRMEQEIERLNELVGQLLSLARMESGVAEFQRERVDLTSIVETVADDAAFEARARDCDVRVTQLDPVVVEGNEALLHSAIENVVRNAVAYTAPGTTVEISVARQADRPDRCAITVRDHGPGIPEAMLEKVFEPFARLDEARDRSTGGYGLGLAIADRAVRVHGGTIQATNHPDGGVRMRIELPARTPGPKT